MSKSGVVHDPNPKWVSDADLEALGELRHRLGVALLDFDAMLDQPREHGLGRLLQANRRLQMDLQIYLARIGDSLKDRSVYPAQIERVKGFKDDLSELSAQLSNQTKAVHALFNAADRGTQDAALLEMSGKTCLH